MNEDNDVTPEMLDSVQQHREQSVNQNSSILNRASDDELRTVLTQLQALPFQDDHQKTLFFESVQRLQGRHVIQIFNLGVVHLQKSATESSKCLEEVVKLFEICSSFCYTADVSKIVAFEYYARALKFCFPSQPTQCLSTAIVSKLLELVQIIQQGKLATIVCDKSEQVFISGIKINGTRHLFGELLEIFETRRDDGYIAELVEQTLRFAFKDAKISHIEECAVENVSLRSDHVVSPVFLTKLMKLLKFANVSNGFASGLAEMDDLLCAKQLVSHGIFFEERNVYQSIVCSFVSILEEMNRSGSVVSLPSDEERLRIFFKYFCCHSKATTTLIKLLATASISNEVLVEVLDQFYCEGKQPSQHFDQSFAEALDVSFKVLSLFPDGELLNKVLKFWKQTFPVDQGYQTLSHLMTLFVEGTSGEDLCRAEKTLDFLDSLDRPLLRSINVWYCFLVWFIKEFPTSFNGERRPEVLFFIRKVVITQQMPDEDRQSYVDMKSALEQFLEWISQQSCTEEMKKEMIWLLMCCADNYKGSFVDNFEFSIDVTKRLSLCRQLQFSTKKSVIQEITRLAKLFKKRQTSVFREFVEGVVSDQNLELKEEILTEILYFVKRCSVMGTIPADILQLFSLVSKSPLSGDRRVKVLQTSNKSGKGLQCGLHILQLTESHHHVLKKGANEYFDTLLSAFVDILKEDKVMCQQFFDQQHRFYIPAQVQDVWSFVVARMISLGLFKQEIDSWCCLPVLEEAWELNSPLKMLQLYSQVRTSAVKVVDLLRHRSEMCLSPDAPMDRSQIPDCVPQTFVSSLGIVVRSNVLSGQEKLLLVKNVCDIFVRCPNTLTEQTVENALSNLIPFSRLQDSNSSTNKDVMRLEVNQIEAILENPTMMAQLSQLPATKGTSLCSVFSTKNSDYFSRGNLIDVYHFIGSQEHLDEVFFSNFVPILDIAIQESSSVEGVLEIVEELVGILRAVPSERIPFIMVNLGYLLENQVDKQERELFLKEVVMKWDFSLNSSALSYLEVPRLLWKVFTTTNTPSKRSELIVRVQEILKKTKHVESFCATNAIRRRIACCELECLVLHSSLSTDEAALACDLSFRSFNERLRCFTFSDIQIEEGCIKFAPQETRSETADSDNISAASAAVDNVGNDSPAIEPQPTILTPVSIAQKVIHHLKRVLRQGEDLTKIAFSLWDRVFDPRLFRCEAECTESLPFLDDYVDVFLSILTEASSTEIMLHWAKVDRHHLCQCSEVVLKACKVSGDAEDIGMEAMLKFQAAVSTTMETIRKQTPSTTNASLPFIMQIMFSVPCFRILKPQLKHLSNMLDSRLPIDVTTTVLNLLQTNFQAGVTVADIISSWSCKHQTMELVNSVHLLCQKEDIYSLNPAQSEFVWQLLKAFGRFCKNSCEDLLVRFEELIDLYDPEDTYAFNRLPKWRQTMIADGFPADVIDCWCVAFLTTPLENLSSRDVDAIVDLNSRSFQLVAHASVSQRIKSCIFPEDGFQDTQGEGIMEPTTKERLRLARLLGEFINILKLRKPEENRKDAVIREIVVDACDELCEAHENQKRRKNDLYKIHEQKLKVLFTEVFGKQRKTDDNDMTGQTVEGESRGTVSVARQSSYYHENLPRILSHNKVYEPLLVLLRRWLSRTVVKPTLASRTLEIVQLLFSVHSSEMPGPNLEEELHDIIQVRVLSLEENQALMAQLQAVGYNQKEEGALDLWSSPMVKCSGYLTKREDPDIRVFRKKLTQVLRRLWNEWKNILYVLGVSSIKVGKTDVCTKDLFGLQASLEEMEEQASAVKKAVNQIEFGNLAIDRSVRQLMRQEQQHRARIEKLYKGNKSSEACGNEKGEMKKFVAVWENRFLENIKLCSERIPGCYAPNGFHSEKPVLCALSVDNRILTVFKEEKNGRREEIENVEVKLLEAGMYVYGLHTSGHDYVTDELWAAFFKMLLEERLVPSIVLSNESPGFDWIKEYVQPVTSHPCPWKWELHQGIVPPEEDYFDYRPINAALWPHFYGLTNLTRENVASFQFKDFKDAFAVEEKENRTKEMTGKAIKQLKNELRLVHGDSEPIRKVLAGKLAFVVKQTIKSIVDGDLPTEETVKELIDMDKLTYRNHKVQRTDESRQQYAAAVLRACTENFEL